MISLQTLLQFAIIAVAIFLATGGVALVNTLINGHSSSNDPYPKLTALTPIAMFLIILGVTGVFLVILSPQNIRNGNVKLAEKQFWVGFTLMFTCYVCLELLFRLGLMA